MVTASIPRRKGDLARCDSKRQLAARATARLSELIAGGEARIICLHNEPAMLSDQERTTAAGVCSTEGGIHMERGVGTRYGRYPDQGKSNRSGTWGDNAA